MSYSANVGAWTVEVSPLSGVIAEKRATGEIWSASLTRFPVGYRVGLTWTNGVAEGDPMGYGIPRAVVAKARALAQKLTEATS